MLEGTSTATFLLYHEPEAHRGRGVLCRKPQGRLYFPRNEKKKLTQAWSSVPSFLLSFTQYKGGPFPQGSKHMEDPSRTIHSSLSDLYLPLAPLHLCTHVREALSQLGLLLCVWNSHLRNVGQSCRRVRTLLHRGKPWACACGNRVCWLAFRAQRRSVSSQLLFHTFQP